MSKDQSSTFTPRPNSRDLSGLRFGKLLSIRCVGRRQIGNPPRANLLWLCRCDCGQERIVITNQLTTGSTTTCGKCPKSSPRFKDLSGRVFERLTAIRCVQRGPDETLWECRCECGNHHTVSTKSLMKGNCRSCGCLRQQPKTHGLSVEKTSEYRAWVAIKTRCRNPKSTGYEDYGGRGLTVCRGWSGVDGLAHFLADMGPKPTRAHSIDRKDNDGGYTCGHCDECVRSGWPANCRWATRTEQANNCRRNHLLNYRGETLNVTQWAQRIGMPKNVLRLRLSQGWSVQRAIEQPVRKIPPRTGSQLALS